MNVTSSLAPDTLHLPSTIVSAIPTSTIGKELKVAVLPKNQQQVFLGYPKPVV